MSEPKSLIDGVVAAVIEAGEIIEHIRASDDIGLTAKSDDSPVTRADRAANQHLHSRLLALETIGWLSEESADSADRLSRDALWIVDPLDGTKEFVEGVPQYAIAVALVRNGVTTLGVIHNPAATTTTLAWLGGGAWRDGRRLSVAEGNTLLSSRSEMRTGEFYGFDEWRLEPVGSIAHKLAMVAAGEGALTLSRGPKWEWDVCAGALIVEEAGGVATDMFGGRLSFNAPFPKVRGILAGAPAAVDRLTKLLSSLGPSARMAEFS